MVTVAEITSIVPALVGVVALVLVILQLRHMGKRALVEKGICDQVVR